MAVACVIVEGCAVICFSMIVRTNFQAIEQAPFDLDAWQIEYNYEQPYDALAVRGGPWTPLVSSERHRRNRFTTTCLCTGVLIEYTDTRDDYGEQCNSGGTL